MEHTPFTARNVCKYVAQALVAQKAAAVAEEALTTYTSLEEDDKIVDLGCKVIGWGVSSRLKPHTDRLVDKAADFVVEQREKRQAKKSESK